MLYFTVNDLEEVGYQAFTGAGAPESHARTVAKHLVENNILGHHSHGIIRVIGYNTRIKDGAMVADAEPEVVDESATTAVVDGHWTFGQVAAELATDTAIEKAKSSGMAAVSLRNLSHLGRVGHYAERMADEGLASILFVACGGWGRAQAPFGGKEARLCTNPMAMGFPYHPGTPFLTDIATSATAEGKLRVYRARGEKVKEGWILDAEGRPSTDPNDFYNGGSILPTGGISSGHKGYALAFMVDLFGSVLSQGGSPGQKSEYFSNTSLFIALDVSRFAPLEKLRKDGDAMVNHVKDTPLIDESKPVLFPGEMEAAARKDGAKKRIGLEEETWNGIVDVLREYSRDEIAQKIDIADQE